MAPSPIVFDVAPHFQMQIAGPEQKKVFKNNKKVLQKKKKGKKGSRKKKKSFQKQKQKFSKKRKKFMEKRKKSESFQGFHHPSWRERVRKGSELIYGKPFSF